MKKTIMSLMCLGIIAANFSGCAKVPDGLTEARKMAAMEVEASVEPVKLSVLEKETLIYGQVLDRTLLDVNDLEKNIPQADLNSINVCLDSLEQLLCGGEDILGQSYYTDYLLWEFEKTPYAWEIEKTEIQGMDVKSRSVVVDITYRTTADLKRVVSPSRICLGDLDYDKKVQVRYDRYMALLKAKYNSRGITEAALAQAVIDEEKFIEVYGSFEEIYQEQRELSLTDELRDYITCAPEDSVTGSTETWADILAKMRAEDDSESGSVDASGDTGGGTDDTGGAGDGGVDVNSPVSGTAQKTYAGLVDSDLERYGGKLVIRCILSPEYVLGMQRGYTLKHMYRLSYTLDGTDTLSAVAYTGKDEESIRDVASQVLTSYYRGKDEDDFMSLHKYTKDFSTVDKYYKDYFETTYRKHDNFTLLLTEVDGTSVKCTVTVSIKERPKGSEMSMPIYTEKYYYELSIPADRDNLCVVQEILLKSEIEGEPSIITQEVSLTGFSSSVFLSEYDNAEISLLIQDFGNWQFGDRQPTAEGFEKVVDMSLSANQIENLLSAAETEGGSATGKSVFFLSYLEGTKNYASMRCRELVRYEDGSIRDWVITYEFIKKGENWLIYGFTVNSDVNYAGTELTVTGVLCTVGNVSGVIETEAS